MMEAIAISVGVPLSELSSGYASELCRTSPTGAPTPSPISNRMLEMTTAADVRTGHGAMEDMKHGVTMAVTAVRPLSFSIYRVVPGKQSSANQFLPLYILFLSVLADL